MIPPQQHLDTNAKPSSPPPAYTEVVEPSSSTTIPNFTTQHHPSYGPTPTTLLQQQTHVLPYYDPRSDWSMREGISRARWRFLGAVAWALVVLILAGLLMGFEARYRVITGRWLAVLFRGEHYEVRDLALGKEHFPLTLSTNKRFTSIEGVEPFSDTHRIVEHKD